MQLVLELPVLLLTASLLWACLCRNTRIGLGAALLLTLISFSLGALPVGAAPATFAIEAVSAAAILGMGVVLLSGDLESWLVTATGAASLVFMGFAAGHGQLAEATAATFLFAFLLASARPFKGALREKLERSSILVQALPGALPIDRLNHVLGLNIHHIARRDVIGAVNGLEEMRLIFAGIKPEKTAEILSDLKALPEISLAKEERRRFANTIRFFGRHIEPTA
jgi:hypothetical protein